MGCCCSHVGTALSLTLTSLSPPSSPFLSLSPPLPLLFLSLRFMGSVCVGTTLQVFTVSAALHSTTTDPGNLLTDSQGLHTSAGSVSVTGMPRAAVLIGRCGGSPASAAEVCVSVYTAQRDATVRAVRLASTETPRGRTRPRTPVNHVAATPWVQYPSTWVGVLSVTLPTETVSASPAWGAPTATGAWWDTGVSMTTAAVRATVQETATPLQDTACLGQIWTCIIWRETPVSW